MPAGIAVTVSAPRPKAAVVPTRLQIRRIISGDIASLPCAVTATNASWNTNNISAEAMITSGNAHPKTANTSAIIEPVL